MHDMDALFLDRLLIFLQEERGECSIQSGSCIIQIQAQVGAGRDMPFRICYHSRYSAAHLHGAHMECAQI